MTTYDRPPYVLCDQDGVLADLEAGFWAQWAELYPDAPQQADADTSKFYIHDQLPAQYRDQANALRNMPGFYRNLPVVPGAVEALHAMLAAGWDVRICTAPLLTNSTCASDKLAWIDEVLGDGWSARTIIAKDKSFVRGDVLIDDKPELTTALTPTWRHVVFDSPYNQGSPSPHRLTGWDTWSETLTPLLGRTAAA